MLKASKKLNVVLSYLKNRFPTKSSMYLVDVTFALLGSFQKNCLGFAEKRLEQADPSADGPPPSPPVDGSYRGAPKRAHLAVLGTFGWGVLGPRPWDLPWDRPGTLFGSPDTLLGHLGPCEPPPPRKPPPRFLRPRPETLFPPFVSMGRPRRRAQAFTIKRRPFACLKAHCPCITLVIVYNL